MSEDELLRLSNAEYRFEESELVEMLHGLRGEWVMPALGKLAVAASDPLLKAVLVEGLFGFIPDERLGDQRAIPFLDVLMGQLARRSDDPFAVGGVLASAAYMTLLGPVTSTRA